MIAADTLDRARAYVSKMPPAISGQHGHDATFAVCCTLVRFGLTEAEAMLALNEFNARCLPPWREADLIHKLRGAFAAVRPDARFTISAPSTARPPVSLRNIGFDAAKLKALSARGPQPKSWRHWLWERSPKRPETMNPLAFLKHLFQPGETILAFDSFEAKSPTWRVDVADPMDCRTPAEMYDGGSGRGAWFLCNPVDGQWHDNPRTGKRSCRSEECVTAFRYAVLESDKAHTADWLGGLAQLPVPIAAIYTSGGRSIHGLIRVDAATKAEWDAAIAPLKRPLAVLGADPGALSAVRLSRLPGCHRPEARGFQRLLFLNPESTDIPLAELPVRFSRDETLAHWKQTCPRWTTGAEAFA